MLEQLLPSPKPYRLPPLGTWPIWARRAASRNFSPSRPQKLKVLREHALIESAVSSNRIEGVTVDKARVATVIFGKSLLRERDEEEVRGYRDALKGQKKGTGWF